MAWPSSVPELLAEQLVHDPGDTRVRHGMDVGPDQVRTRTTAARGTISGLLRLTKAEVDALETHFVTTTSNGTASFTMDSPLTGSSITVRWVNRPSYSMLAPHDTVASRKWSTPALLEILP